MARTDGQMEKAEVVEVSHDDEDDLIDQEQLDDYREMIEQLGSFPDKVTINSLSMVAEDHANSKANARAIYECITQPLISKRVPSDRKLPLVYVIDSILKNVKGEFVSIIEQDAKKWMPIVYIAISETGRTKLKKVWNLWKDSGFFQESSWKEMGTCFASDGSIIASTAGEDPSASEGSTLRAKLKMSGITLAKDGGLVIKPMLRKAMQQILDDLQSDVHDELEKVSLERLASIDPDLLAKIKGTAEESLGTNGTSVGGGPTSQHEEPDVLSFLIETRPPDTIERSKAWGKLDLNFLKETHELIATLQHLVRGGSSSETTYTQSEAIEMTGAVASAACTATILTNALHQVQNQDENTKLGELGGLLGTGTLNGGKAPTSRVFLSVEKKFFTSQGVKQKNDTVVGILYEIGLPFVSSADGRRFSTQMELSNHLDALFKKGQLERTMAKTEERGWYVSDLVFTGEAPKSELGNNTTEATETKYPSADDDEADPSTFTVPADESRDRCVICGINFKMFFDNDDGIYKYNNCREIQVLNDEASEEESEELLVHVTCWRGLGSPAVLTMDQALQEAIHH